MRLIPALILFFPALALAAPLPTGGVVTSGAASLSQQGSTLTVNQASPVASLNWQSFNVAAGNTVNFVQPTSQSVAVNRVVGNDASAIYGNLNANGQVFLINPNGILFGKTAQVDVGGLVASTQDVTPGTLPAALASRSGLTGNVTNLGTIEAAAGNVDLLGKVVGNQGVIQAASLDTTGGHIRLMGAAANGQVGVGGELSAPQIETSAASVQVAPNAQVNTNGGLWLIDPTDFTVAASGGDMTGAQVTSALASGNFSILSSSGSTGTLGNININDVVTWSANTLTLTAANDVNVNAVMTATGAAGLVINTATANGSDAAVVGGRLNMGMTPVAAGVIPTGFVGQINLTPTNKLTINGNNYTVISGLGVQGSTTGADLQGMSGNLSGYYALGNNIDASATGGWNGGSGFSPLSLTGTLNGLGHSVDALTSPSGLFTDLGGSVNNVALTNENLTNANQATGTGGLGITLASTISSYNLLVGLNSVPAQGTVSASYGGFGGLFVDVITGDIDNAHTSAVSVIAVDAQGQPSGGLAGTISGGSSTIENSSSSIGFSVGWPAVGVNPSATGGLVGIANGGSITSSFATGAITSNAGRAGGLVGVLSDTTVGGICCASISNSYATGNINGDGNPYPVGGLVGFSGGGTINNSYATGTVSGMDAAGGILGGGSGATLTGVTYSGGGVTGIQAGGIVGYASGNSTISNATNSAPITANYGTGNNYAGGIAGNVNGVNLDSAVNTGAISCTVNAGSSCFAGGLVGSTSGSINDSYNTGAVSGQNAGGLVGMLLDGLVYGSYSTGGVNGVSNAVDTLGGLVGSLNGSNGIVASYASGNVTCAGYGGCAAGGLVGSSSASITGSYAVGMVTGLGTGTNGNQFYTGGIVGMASAGNLNPPSPAGNYYDAATTGQSQAYWLFSSAGGGSYVAVAGNSKSDAAMKQQSTFVGWDFTNVWGIQNGTSYPYFGWAYAAGAPMVVQGNVLDTAGAPVSGAEINVMSGGQDIDPTYTRADGSYYTLIDPSLLQNDTLVSYATWGGDGTGIGATMADGYSASAMPFLPIKQETATILTTKGATSQVAADLIPALGSDTDATNAVMGSVGQNILILPTSDFALDMGLAPNDTLVVKTPGNLTIAPSTTLGGNNVVLDAGGAFINNAGSGAIQTVAGYDVTNPTGWAVRSNNPAGDTFGSLDSANTATWDGATADLMALATSGTNNYVFDYQPTLTLGLTGTATKTYGQDVTAALNDGSLAGFTPTITGLQSGVANAFNGDTMAVLTSDPSVTSTGAPATANAGTYGITISGGSVGNGYALAFDPAGQIDVGKAMLTYVANAATSVYGATPSLTGTVTGFVNGDTVADLTGAPTWTGAGGALPNVGSYAINGGGYTSGNYTFQQGVGGQLTVNPAPLFASIAGTYSRTADGTTTASVPGSAITLTGFAPGQGVSVAGPLSGNYNSAVAGQANTITLNLTPADFTALAGTNLSNYVLPASASTGYGYAQLFAPGSGPTFGAPQTQPQTAQNAATGNANTQGGSAGNASTTLVATDLTGSALFLPAANGMVLGNSAVMTSMDVDNGTTTLNSMSSGLDGHAVDTSGCFGIPLPWLPNGSCTNTKSATSL